MLATPRTITGGSVEARAFFGGARKVRYFDTIEEADRWLLGLQAQHAGCTTDRIDHQTDVTSRPALRRAPAAPERTLLDEARDAGPKLGGADD
jgi:hypothetical protein